MAHLSSSTPSSKSCGKSKAFRERSVGFKLLAVVVALMALWAVMALPKYKLFAWNYTPSLPQGLYVRAVMDSPAVGKIVAFVLPPVAEDYARQRGMNTNDLFMIKPLVAGPGDHVCVTDELRINGQHVAQVQKVGTDGAPLPKWDGCRRLEDGEWFTYAPRIWNSFDGRYYGPVRESTMIGVYRPLWVSD